MTNSCVEKTKMIINSFGKLAPGTRAILLIDAVIINAAHLLTTGVILTGYAIYLGATDFMTGIISTSSEFSTLLSIFAFLIYERLRKRKKVLLIINFASRFPIFLIILVPELFGNNQNTMMFFLCALIIFSHIFWGIYRVGWLVWSIDQAGKDSKNNFIYLRMSLIRIVGIIVTLGSGFIIDYYDRSYKGFVIVFTTAFILSIIDLFVLGAVKEKSIQLNKEIQSISFDRFIKPLRSYLYRRFLTYNCIVYLSYTASKAYIAVYLVKYLGYSYKVISTGNVISIFIMIFAGHFWNKVEMKRGRNFALKAIVLVIAVELVVLSLINEKSIWIYFTAAAIQGFGTGAFYVFSMAIRYSIMQDEDKTIFEGWYFFSHGLAALIAPVLGGALLGVLNRYDFYARYQNPFQLLFLTTVVSLVMITFTKLTKQQTDLKN